MAGVLGSVAAAAALAAYAAFAARREILQLSNGKDVLSPIRIAVPSFLAALVAAAILDWRIFETPGLLAVLLSGLLAALSLTDRDTAWAPDALIVPLVALIGAQAALSAGLPPLAGLAAGLGILILLRALDRLLAPRVEGCPPPPDVIALLSGPALLGIGAPLAAALILASGALLMLRMRPGLMWIFANPEAAKNAREDLGYEEEAGPAVPLLAILFPVYLAVFLLMQACPQLSI